MPCPLWLRINESVDGDSINSLNPDGGVVVATLSMVTVFWNPDGGVMFATLSMVTVSLTVSIYNFAFESVDGDSIYKP